MTNSNNIQPEEIKVIKLREYSELSYLGNENEAVNDLNNFGSETYICDAIAEIADSYTPIYNNEIWENVKEIAEYIEDAISEGLVYLSNANLTDVFQLGYYKYYTQVLYSNLDNFIFNFAASSINEYIIAHNITNVSTSELEDMIERFVKTICSNDTFGDLEESIHEVVECIESLQPKLVELCDYNVLEDVGGELNALYKIGEYRDNSYILDAIHDVAEEQTNMVEDDLFEVSGKIKEYIDGALSDGGVSHNEGIYNILKAGVRFYYANVLDYNVGCVQFNYVATIVNKHIEENSLVLDVNELSNKISDNIETESCTVGINTFEQLLEIAQEIIESI